MKFKKMMSESRTRLAEVIDAKTAVLTRMAGLQSSLARLADV